MASIRNLSDFNRNRQELLKIKTVNDEVILFTKTEAREALVKYIDEELDLFNNGIAKETKDKLQERVNFQLKQIENSLMRYLDDKMNKITETIVINSTSRVIEEEVNRRLNIKIEEIKKRL
jgi:hypothetical protein